MESTEVEQGCNNLRTVHSTNEELRSSKGMGKPKADTILAIHHLKKDLPNVKDCRHVYADQDTRTVTVKKPADAKQKKKGMTIDCTIEKITTQANMETDYLSSGDKTEHLT
jgi:hypothetical protein